MTGTRPLVLYVDDDPDARDSVRAVIESAGYAMAEAASGEEGLKVYDRASPDFIIVDMMMEEIDAGSEFITELRVRRNAAPVYMLSSIGDTLCLNVDPRSLGVEGILQKPLEPETLLALLRAHLGVAG